MTVIDGAKMLIGSSTFDAIHKRDYPVYNRAALELVLCILFDNTLAFTAGSLVDSPVLLKLFGEYARSKRGDDLGIHPFKLFIDSTRHFKLDDVDNIIQKIMESYLCGRAQTGEDKWNGDESSFPLNYNFAFMPRDYFEKMGRGDILLRLRNNISSEGIFDNCSWYIRDNAADINHYMSKTPQALGHVGDTFKNLNYQSRLIPLLRSMAQELEKAGLSHITSSIEELSDELSSKDAFNRNQLGKFGPGYVGDTWKTHFQPMINIHYHGLLSELCGCNYTSSIELWDADSTSASDLISTVIGGDSDNKVADLWIKREHRIGDVEYEDARHDSIKQIDWSKVIGLRRSAQPMIDKIRKTVLDVEYSDRDCRRAIDEYVEFIARNIEIDLKVLDFDGQKITVVLSSEKGGLLNRHAAAGWMPIELGFLRRPNPARIIGAITGAAAGASAGVPLGSVVGQLMGGEPGREIGAIIGAIAGAPLSELCKIAAQQMSASAERDQRVQQTKEIVQKYAINQDFLG